MENSEKSTFNEKIGFKKQVNGIASKSIHAGQRPETWMSRPIVPPIFTSVSYEQTIPRNHSDYIYSRVGNPSRTVLEESLAALDNSKYAVTFSAGVSAITTLILTLKKGDGIVASKTFYSGTLDCLAVAEKVGFEVQYVDYSDLKSLEDSIKPNTRLVWTEPCMNPTMHILDIKVICDLVHRVSKNALVVVDNTFLTPYFHRPLDFGADVALYSLTKYFSGHSDIVGGSITTNNKQLFEVLRDLQGTLGTMLSPFDCYLVSRSLKTLTLRMEAHSRNSYKVAQFLQSHPAVRQVNHPALPSHRGHEIAMRQFSGHSGVLSFYLAVDSNETVVQFFRGLKFVLVCTSLGGVETGVSHPRVVSHVRYTDEEAASMGVTNSLIRISVGVEDVEDIIGDLKVALDGVLSLKSKI